MTIISHARLLIGRGMVARQQQQGARLLSLTSARLGSVELSQDESSGIATISMNRAPANSLNLEFLQELTKAIKTAEQNSKGLLLTSSLPTIFSAGLEITEMYQPDMARIPVFWSSLQELWLALYGCRLPTVAAIAGHSPAGGCLLAMSCDYRVMVRKNYSIGLNETLLGIVAPFWFKDTMVNTIGQRQTELALMLGSLFTADQALSIGLVDKAVDSREEAVLEATRVLSNLMKLPQEARHVTKMLMRQPTLDKLAASKQQDIDSFVKFVTQPIIQEPLGAYLSALKNKKKK